MKKVVYTVITAGKDKLNEINKHIRWKYLIYKHIKWDYMCFTDDLSKNVFPWKKREISIFPLGARRSSRLPKILAHEFLKDYEYSIYIDGHIKLKADPDKLLKYLGENDIAFFKHPWRSCIYDEANAVIDQNRDQPQIVGNQMNMYLKEGYPKNNGLICGHVIVRRHNDKIAELNKLWCDIYSNYSQRDQLSFNYCAWKLGVKYSIIPGSTYEENLFVTKKEHEITTTCKS